MGLRSHPPMRYLTQGGIKPAKRASRARILRKGK
nr:MAG TPA: hypothetical protein [Bacteriophage sp.]